MRIGITTEQTDIQSNSAYYLKKALHKLGYTVTNELEAINIAVEHTSRVHVNTEGKTKGKTVYWDGDGCLRGGKPEYNADYTFTTCKHHPSPHSIFLPFAADPDIHKKMREPDYDIVFVGRLDPMLYPDRVRLIELLGKKYKTLVTTTPSGFPYSIEMSRGKLIFNRTISMCANMRFFEGMAIGALVSNNPLIEDAIPNEHYIAYGTDEELIEKMDEYLKDDKKREKIAKQSREYILNGHTYEHRAQTILSYL